MSLISELSEGVETILTTSWETRDGIVVPDTETVKHKGGAVKINATFLYADLAGSSKLASMCPGE